MSHQSAQQDLQPTKREETTVRVLREPPDSVHRLTEKSMIPLLAQFLLGAPDVSGMRVAEATPWAQGRSLQLTIEDRYGEGRSFLVPIGHWHVEG